MIEIKKDILRRVYLVYFATVIFGLAIIIKAVYIQYFEGKELVERAKKQELRLFDVEAMRGNITSDDGTLLATSVPNFDVRMDVSSVNISDDFFKKNVDSLSYDLAKLFPDKSVFEYKEMLWEARRSGDRFMMIHHDVTYSDLRKMHKFPIFKLGKFRGGLIVIPHYKRELPYKNLAKRTIGFESEEAIKKVYVGLEGSFTKNLQGMGGKRLMRRVSSTNWVPVDMDNEVEPQNGDDIITSFDINLQDMVETALMHELILDSADHGCAIVMEVKTGYIKAMANLGKTGKGNYAEIFNYAVGESSEPGSTFKLASFLVALEDGKIDLDTKVNTGNGTVFYSGAKMEDSHKGLGAITALEVFEKSSNVGTSKLIYNAYLNEQQKFVDGLKRMWKIDSLGLQIKGEGKSVIHNTYGKSWSAISLPWMSIGYEIKLTPLQILTLYNAIANNGVMVKPLLVKEIRKNGQVEQTFPPEVINPSVCSLSTLAKARTMLEGVVIRGTGADVLKNAGYRIAGKTGTAQLADRNKGYKVGTKAHYKGSFVGYFPADNPKYSCFVMIYRPLKGKYYGAQIAAPVFKAISDRIYANLKEINNPPVVDTSGFRIPNIAPGMQKDIQLVYDALGVQVNPVNRSAQWARSSVNNSVVTLTPEILPITSMPDVVGMSVKDAVFVLEEMGLKVFLNGKGTVMKQSLESGKKILKGTVVILELSTVKT